MAIPTFVATAVSSWSAYYGDHQLVSVSIRYLHIAGTVVGGGQALSIDRELLAARRLSTVRDAALSRLRGSHRVVIPTLAVVALTGLLMTAADLDTFLESNVYWLKIGLALALTVNGALLLAAETAVVRAENDRSWRRLAFISAVSVLLWMATLLVGTWLTVAA